MREMNELPVAVIGAGPIGLAAAARLVERGLTPLILEAGPGVGTALRAWGHVRVFSPWIYNIDDAARRLLMAAGWQAPAGQALPTGGEIVRDYLEPLAAHPAIAPHLRCNAKVTAIARQGVDKLSSKGREDRPFQIRWQDAAGREEVALVRAVIDASGTWASPNPIGTDGLPVPGESDAADRIAYGIPDVLDRERAAYAGKRVLVIGGGHSAINGVLDLIRLQESAPETRIAWGLRSERIDRLLGGGLNDKLPARGALGLAASRAIADGKVEILAPFAVERIERTADGLSVVATRDGKPLTLGFDRIVVATGFRPALDMLREVRVEIDPAVEAPPALAPMIDPNLHSCGTVRPHGAAELAHPERDFYIVGSKSYGRAPTFLMLTGYEQVRSVVAAIAGDHASARRVELVLPETGVCSATPAAADTGEASGCCPAPKTQLKPQPKAESSCCAPRQSITGCGSQQAASARALETAK